MEDQRQPLLSTCPNQVNNRLRTARGYTRRYLNSKIGHYSILLLVSLDCLCIFSEFIVQSLRCEQRIPESSAKTTQEALGIIGLVFSCLFMLELTASIWAFGFRFFRSKFHCFDATVIVVSFVVDVLLRGILEEIASLVIVLRLWRVFKIIEELSVGSQEQTEGLRQRIEALEKEKSQLEVDLAQLQSEEFHA